jgi:tetratricopeptide (TPR) repeat protein
MKRVSLILAVITLLISPLCGEDSSQELLQKYYESPNTENLLAVIQAYSKRIADDSLHTGARINLAYIHYNELLKHLEVVSENHNLLAPGELFQYANLLLALNRYNDAIAVYNTLNEQIPNWSCPWRHKGEAYWKSGDLEKAEESLLQAIETRKEHYDAYVMLSYVQYEMGKVQEALATLETGLTYRGKDIEDPQEEVDELDMQFFYMRLLKENNHHEEYEKLRSKLQEQFPQAYQWEKIEE